MKKYRWYHKFLSLELLIPKSYRKKLEEEGVLEKFIKNVLKQSPYGRRHLVFIDDRKSFKRYVLSAFVWGDTPEGIMFWSYISKL